MSVMHLDRTTTNGEDLVVVNLSDFESFNPYLVFSIPGFNTKCILSLVEHLIK